MSVRIAGYLADTADLIGGDGAPAASSISSQIAASLREQIHFGVIKPGQAIKEIPLARAFGVSRGPVRDALKILARQGLIAINGRAGAAVREVDLHQLRSIFRTRAELGSLIYGQAAAAKKCAREVTALEEAVDLLATIAADPEAPLNDYIRVRRRLSAILQRISGFRYIARLALAIELEIAVHWAGILSKERQLASAGSWRRLVGAILEGDVAEAERLGRQITLDSYEELARRHQSGLI